MGTQGLHWIILIILGIFSVSEAAGPTKEVVLAGAVRDEKSRTLLADVRVRDGRNAQEEDSTKTDDYLYLIRATVTKGTAAIVLSHGGYATKTVYIPVGEKRYSRVEIQDLGMGPTPASSILEYRKTASESSAMLLQGISKDLPVVAAAALDGIDELNRVVSERLANNNPTDATVRDQLGEVLDQTRKSTDLGKLYQEALTASGTPEDRQQRLQSLRDVIDLRLQGLSQMSQQLRFQLDQPGTDRTSVERQLGYVDTKLRDTQKVRGNF